MADVPEPTVDKAALAAYIGVDADDPYIEGVHAEAAALVADVFTDAHRDVPVRVVDRVFKDVGHDLYARRDSPSGASQYATGLDGGAPVRAPRDPFHQSWPIIRRYVVPL